MSSNLNAFVKGYKQSLEAVESAKIILRETQYLSNRLRTCIDVQRNLDNGNANCVLPDEKEECARLLKNHDRYLKELDYEFMINCPTTP